jgi:hypothetical protein
VHRLQSIVQGIVGDSNGRAEPVAGVALFATFDSVVAAVQAAVTIQRRIVGETFEGHARRSMSACASATCSCATAAPLATRSTSPQGWGRWRGRARSASPILFIGRVRNKFDGEFVDLGSEHFQSGARVPDRGERVDGTARTAAPRWCAALVVVAVATLIALRWPTPTSRSVPSRIAPGMPASSSSESSGGSAPTWLGFAWLEHRAGRRTAIAPPYDCR